MPTVSTPIVPPSIPGNAAAVVARVQSIDHILQVRGSYQREPVAVEGGVHAVFEPGTAHGRLATPTALEVQVSLRLRLEGKAANSQPLFDSGAEGAPESERQTVASIASLFVVIYTLSPGGDLSVEDVNAFANANGLFNVWPYWREFVSSCFVRAGMPQLIVPVLKLAPAAATPKS